MASSSAAWVLGGGAVDLIRQQHVRKNRPFNKNEIAPAVVLIHNHTSAGHVCRHQVHGELNPTEAEVQNAGERPHQSVFTRSRHPLDQHMATGKKGDQNILNQLLMTDNSLGQFGLNPLKSILKFKNQIGYRRVTHCTVPPAFFILSIP